MLKYASNPHGPYAGPGFQIVGPLHGWAWASLQRTLRPI